LAPHILELEHAIGISQVPSGLHYHPNGREYLYAVGASVVITQLADLHEQCFLCGHNADICALDVSTSGQLIASGQRGGNTDAIIWHYDSKSILHRLSEHDYEVAALSFSRDELLLCTIGSVDDSKLAIWDVSTGAIVSIVTVASSSRVCLAWGGMVKDFKQRDTVSYVLCGAFGSNIAVWEVNPFSGEVNEERLSAEGRGTLHRIVTALDFATDLQTIYCATSSGDVMVVSVCQKIIRSRTMLVSHSGLTAIEAVQGGLIVGCNDGTVTILDASLVRLSRAQLPGAVFSLSVLPNHHDELLVAVASGSVHRIRLPDLTQTLLVSDNHSAAVRALAFSGNDSALFSTASSDCSIRIWDTDDFRAVMTVAVRDAGLPLCLVYTPDVVLSGWTDGKVRAHDPQNASPLWQIDNAHAKSVTSLVMAPNERFIVSGGILGDVRVWELRSRDLVSHLKEHNGAITGLKLYSDNIHLVSCSKDRSFHCWDLRNEKRISSHTQRMGGINSIALSHNQTAVFTVGQEKRITLWNLSEETHLMQRDLDSSKLDEANAIAVSRDGNLIATGGTSREIRLWNPHDLAMITTVKGHSDSILDLAFSPDNHQLVSCGEDSVVLVWNILASPTFAEWQESGV